MFHAAAIVQSELNCPFCFALNEWIDGGGWAQDVAWRGVEHEPGIAVPPRLEAARQELLTSEVGELAGRAPGVRLAPPSVRPSSRRGLVAVAFLERERPQVAAPARTALFRALWWDGLDISDLGVLDQVLAPFGWDRRHADDAQARAQVQAATAAWRDRQWNRIPVIEAITGTTYLGLGTRPLLTAFMGSALFDVDRGGACEVEP